MMNFDDVYKNVADVFGTKPEKMLATYVKRLSGLRPFLDLGAGQGRHTLFLARHGFSVDAVDPSHVAMDAIAEQARAEELVVRTYTCGFETFVPDVDYYSGVGAFGLIQVLSREDRSLLIRKITEWTGPGSLVFLTAFTVADPGYEQWERHCDRIGHHSFANEEGQIRSYLEPGEIMSFFESLEPLHHWEGFGPSHRHGDGPFERHAVAQAVFRRPA
ncbi:MAG: class I SAM-dependent methyltransferase [Candidatus Latescibacterota bacterium]|nr:MAG: class I SAM-dependent methyltransferase [Candidatus Latescibacterota bacterium]